MDFVQVKIKWKWKGKQEGERKEGEQCCEWFWDFQEKYSSPESIVVTWFCYKRERERERGRGRRGEREKERWFGEAGMAQIVVYNRTGIETRFVAFQLAYALVRGERRERRQNSDIFDHMIRHLNDVLFWKRCHVRNTWHVHAFLFNHSGGWMHFHFFFFWFSRRRNFFNKLKIKMGALLSHFFFPPPSSITIEGKFLL